MTIFVKLNLAKYSETKLLTLHRNEIITDDELWTELKEREWTDYKILTTIRINRAA